MAKIPPLVSSLDDAGHQCHDWMAGKKPDALQCHPSKTYMTFYELYAPRLSAAGLLPFAWMLDIGHSPYVDACLLSTLVDRWRPETHTFHLRWGETVTLRDVSYITGLPIRGLPVAPESCGHWQDIALQRLGMGEFAMTSKGKHRRGVHLSVLGGFSTMPDNFDELDEEAQDRTVRTHLFAYLMYMFAYVLFPRSQGDTAHKLFVQFAEAIVAPDDLEEIPVYSWRLAVLAYTYHGLCLACKKKKKDSVLTVCHILLTAWCFEHLPVGRPTSWREQLWLYPGGQDYLLCPMGKRWFTGEYEFAPEVVKRAYAYFHSEMEH